MKLLPLILALASPAYAQASQCEPFTAKLEGLQASYGETVRMQALAADGSVLVITAAPSGMWTAMRVTPDGMACIAAYGEGFAAHDAEPAGTDS